MTLFEVFAREKRELSNTDVARLLDVPESSASDLLFTLHQLGYLMRTARTRRFYPTARLATIAGSITENDPVHLVAGEAVELLSSKTLETSFFGRLDNGAVRVLAVQQGSHALRYVLAVGDRIGLHASAMGKAILSMLPPDEMMAQLRAKPLKAATSKTVVDVDKLAQQIIAIRKSHIARVDSEGTDGVTAYAIAGMIGSEPVAFSCAGPTDRLTARRDEYLVALQDVAAIVFAGRAD
jgi:IclR family acetate operon transcriptional repressor